MSCEIWRCRARRSACALEEDAMVDGASELVWDASVDGGSMRRLVILFLDNRVLSSML